MTSTGQKYPTSGTSAVEASHNSNAVVWSGPTNIYSDNATSATDTTNTAYITAATFDTPDQSQVLYASGFDFSAVPDNATINGVTCRINAWYASGQGSGSIDLLQLLNTSGAIVGTNQCATPVALTTTDTTVVTKGSTSDTWGNALTPSWVKDPDFGVGLGMIATQANADVYVDYITLEVEYTEPTPKALADSGVGADSVATVAAVEDSPALEISGFGTFPEIASIDTIDGVDVAINQYVSDLTMNAPTFQLWDGTSAQIGATQTGTLTTATNNVDTATFTGVSYSQLATLRVRVYAHGPTGTTHSVDYVSLTVDYTPLPGAKMLGDSGSASQTVAVAASAILTTSGAGIDAVTVAAAAALGDSGTASDVLRITAVATSVDAGTCTDSLSVSAAIAFTDASVGGDAWASIDQGVTPKTVSDSGAAADSLSASASVPVADAGVAVDAWASIDQGATPKPVADAGSAADSLSTSVTAFAAESGAGTDVLSTAAAVTAVDTATAVEAMSAAVPIAFADASSATTALSTSAAVSLADAGAAAESLTTSAAVSVADTGVAVDAWASIDQGATPKPVADSGGAADSLTAAATVSSADAATAAESLSTSATLTVTDAGAGVDAWKSIDQGATPKPVADSGLAADVLPVAATAALADGGTQTDAATVTAAIAFSDAAASADAFSNAVPVSAADNAVAADRASVSAAVAHADAATAVDTLTVAAAVTAADPATASDVLAVTRGAISDAATAADAITSAAAITCADAGSATDTLAVVAALTVADTAAATAATTQIGLVFDDNSVVTESLPVAAATTVSDSGVAVEFAFSVFMEGEGLVHIYDSAVGADSIRIQKPTGILTNEVELLATMTVLVAERSTLVNSVTQTSQLLWTCRRP